MGTDSSHVIAFTRLLNDSTHPHHVKGGTVTHAVRYCSDDFELSYSREARFSEQLQGELNVTLVELEELGEHVDVFMLEAADGRAHLELVRQLISWKKPIFIDKPLATSFHEAKQIIELAKENNVPIMSSSALRYSSVLQDRLQHINTVQADKIVVSCPLHIEPTQSRYYWYGIHGVELLYAIRGKGCQSVELIEEPAGERLRGYWSDGTIGEVLCSYDTSQPFGVSIQAAQDQWFISLDDAAHQKPFYASLVEQMIQFFNQQSSLISYEEMLELIWFIEQAETQYNNNHKKDEVK